MESTNDYLGIATVVFKFLILWLTFWRRHDLDLLLLWQGGFDTCAK